MELFPVLWALAAAGLLAVEVAGRLGLFGLAPLGPVLAGLRDNPWGRAALLLGWMWTGWHLFAR